MHSSPAQALDPASLAALPMFEHCDPLVLAALARTLHVHALAARQELPAPSDGEPHLGLVLEGRLRLVHAAGGARDLVILEWHAGDLVEPFDPRCGGPPGLRTVAAGPTRVGRLRGAELLALCARYPELHVQVLAHGAALAGRFAQRIVELSTWPVRRRIHAELLRAARHDPERGALYIMPVPRHAEIASRVSTHREAVTRELGRLARSGVIERQPRRLVIVQPHALDDARSLNA